MPLPPTTAAAEFKPDPEVARFAVMRPRPVTLPELLSCLEPWRAAKFIQAARGSFCIPVSTWWARPLRSAFRGSPLFSYQIRVRGAQAV
ncbi:unnamed protein product [Prorocentrum cordatum]|uniref:Uncharacterized protein n=1 Tax=Prorocentrum cordatum TaxID=2364126 RepID=A0ABN9XF01_9DINO|nr:unnamed protein product [Polarella glacialis]